MNEKERYEYPTRFTLAKNLEKITDFDDLLDWIGNDDVISKDNDVIRWDWIGGVNWYGETIASVEVYKNGQFRVEKNGISVGWFENRELYEMLDTVLNS